MITIIPISEDARTKLEKEEEMDAEDPLRHLRPGNRALDEYSDFLEQDAHLVPAQAPTVTNQVVGLSFGNVDVKLSLDAGPGCGGVAWPAGEVLSSYLAHRGYPYIRGRKVVEIGSGTGLVGLAAAKLGADVVITDQLPLLDLMRKNVLLNDLEEQVRVVELNWGQALPPEIHLNRPADLLLAADCVYFEPAFPLLVTTLCDMYEWSPQAEILFCYKKRRKGDKRFFALLRAYFEWNEVADDPRRDTYSKQGISLLRLKRR